MNLPRHAEYDATLLAEPALQSSLAMRLMRLFAAVSQADGAGRGYDFVAGYYETIFPRDIAQAFASRFVAMADQGLDLDELAKDLNRLSYQEKIFCFLAAYEFIVEAPLNHGATALTRDMADRLGVLSPDLAFIEGSLGAPDATPEVSGRSNILSLRITGDLATADVYLPLPDLDVMVYKVHNIYCVRKKNDRYRITAEGASLTGGFTSTISQHFSLKIERFTLRCQDLIIFFRNKIIPLRETVYVVEQGLELAYQMTPGEEIAVRLDVRGSNILLASMEPDSIVALNGERITHQAYVNGDDLIYVNGFRLDLRELLYYLSARRAIRLTEGKESYELTNDIKGDIFLHDGSPTRWAATLTPNATGFEFRQGDCPYRCFVNGRLLPPQAKLADTDELFVHNTFVRFDREARAFRKQEFSFRKLTADNLSYRFEDGSLGLDGVSFALEYGELACIMGPSGCGKSTLLSVISGLHRPGSGQVLVDQYDLHASYGLLKDHLGYVPQEDLLLANLTVYENLYYHARLRFPDRSAEELAARIDMVINDIRLAPKRDSRVGDAASKALSGGERKRLNIGLELLADAEIYFLDEPTSGLSSKDSEKILELLEHIARMGKIVVAVIHQPSSKLYKLFTKVILLDHGGRMAYFGESFSALEYFKRHLERHAPGEPLAVECPLCHRVQPEILLDSLEDSLLDIDGEVLSERKYSPEYWKEEYRRAVVASWFSSIPLPTDERLPPKAEGGARRRFSQFLTLFARNYKNKVRDRSNLLITFLEAPLLGGACGFILKYAPFDDYSLYTNDLFKTFLFISVIVAIFLSMTSSVDEIITDTPLFLRERMLDITHRSYLAAKFLALILFSVVQNVLFVAMGFLFLEVKELFWEYVALLSALSVTGLSLGLFISSIPKLSSKAALNVVPLVLIPQIILGGALIEYEKMNVQLTLFKNNPVPEVCQFMPSRWGYEGLMVLQETGNRYDSRHRELTERVKEMKLQRETLIAEGGEAHFEQTLRQESRELERFRQEFKHLYGNKNVHDAVSVGEKRLLDQAADTLGGDMDAARALSPQELRKRIPAYPMFVREKVLPVAEAPMSTVWYNILALLWMAALTNAMTLLMLRFRDVILGAARRLFVIKPLRRWVESTGQGLRRSFLGYAGHGK